jgi:acyl-CoA synthetase (AMP-forming)/AMP-acid ligase II
MDRTPLALRQIDYLDQGAAIAGSAPCLVQSDRMLNYIETQEVSHRICNGLLAEKIDAVGILSPNDVLGYCAILGVYRAEATCASLNIRSGLSDFIAHLSLVKAEALFIHSSQLATLPELRAAVPSLRLIVCIDQAEGDIPSLLDWAAQQSSQQAARLPHDENRVYRVAMTGGTTGAPKGAEQTHRQGAAATASFLQIFHYDDGARYLVAAPMTHAAGLFSFHALALGGSLYFVPKPEVSVLLREMSERRITTVILPPTLLYGMLADPNVRAYDWSALRYLIVSTAPASAEKIAEATEVFGPVVAQIYGQTEGGILTFLAPDKVAEAVADKNFRHRLMSCGLRLPGVEIAIMRDDGSIAPDGERGEIVTRSAQQMGGYRGIATDAERPTDGWNHTSDVGYRDADGFYYIVDRKRDMIISGGFNLYPSEIEQVIWSHPAVQDCAVIGVPDARWGEAVKAVVTLKPGASATSDDLIALCKAKLGSMKAPKSVEFWPELPRSPVGKVLKRQVRERFWQGVERNI